MKCNLTYLSAEWNSKALPLHRRKKICVGIERRLLFPLSILPIGMPGSRYKLQTAGNKRLVGLYQLVLMLNFFFFKNYTHTGMCSYIYTYAE